MRGDLGGGGWERPGFLSWTRVINGKAFQFQASWEPDTRGRGREWMWEFYVHVFHDWNGDGSTTYRTFLTWRGPAKPVPAVILNWFKAERRRELEAQVARAQKELEEIDDD